MTTAFDTWFCSTRDEENKIDGVGVPLGTTILYKHCHNDVNAFAAVCELLEQAFNAGQVPADWLPTAENINALPEPIRRYVHDMESNADPAGTVREVTQLRDLVRELSASNRMLRDQVAAFESQGVPDVADLIAGALYDFLGHLTSMEKPIAFGANEWATPAVDALVQFAEKRRLTLNNPAIENWTESLASAPPAPQALTTCNCRWDGETQVQQCTLHEAHIDAIHEWAERAKTAEAKLSAPQAKPQPLSEESMWNLAKYVYGRSQPYDAPQILLTAKELLTIVDFAAHGIKE